MTHNQRVGCLPVGSTIDRVSIHGPAALAAVRIIGSIGCEPGWLHMLHLRREPTAAFVQLAVQVQIPDVLKIVWLENLVALKCSV